MNSIPALGSYGMTIPKRFTPIFGLCFRKALKEHQDLGHMAKRLAEEMPQDRKIMLGVQLYDLIAKAGMQQEQVIAYYSFMSQLGMAAQAIDIVYQLNAADPPILRSTRKGPRRSNRSSLVRDQRRCADEGIGPG